MSANRRRALLCIAYAVVIGIGLLTLPTSDAPIQYPWFTVMELLILVLATTTVAFTVGLHAWAQVQRKSYALLGVVFMSMCALVTCCVHFCVLTLSRHPAFETGSWQTLVLAFRWPSVVYTLDIPAWDIFFPLAALCASLAVYLFGLADLARALLYASAALALFGLAGVPLGNTRVRNIGIVGYVVLFPIASFLRAVVFRREAFR